MDKIEKKVKKEKKVKREIKVVYVNEPEEGVYEEAFATIIARKIINQNFDRDLIKKYLGDDIFEKNLVHSGK